MPTLREYLADDGFVGLADLRREGDDSSFLLAGQQCVGLPPLGALRCLPAGHVGFLPLGVSLESVAALGTGCGTHALPLFVPEKNDCFPFPDSREGGEISGTVPESLPPFRGAQLHSSKTSVESMACELCRGCAQFILGTVPLS